VRSGQMRAAANVSVGPHHRPRIIEIVTSYRMCMVSGRPRSDPRVWPGRRRGRAGDQWAARRRLHAIRCGVGACGLRRRLSWSSRRREHHRLCHEGRVSCGAGSLLSTTLSTQCASVVLARPRTSVCVRPAGEFVPSSSVAWCHLRVTADIDTLSRVRRHGVLVRFSLLEGPGGCGMVSCVLYVY